MSTRSDTATWVRWVLGIIIGAIVVLAGYIGTALATVEYHDKDVAQRERSQEKLEEERKRYLDGKFDDLEQAIKEAR